MDSYFKIKSILGDEKVKIKKITLAVAMWGIIFNIYPQDDIRSKITPEAIESRIKEIRMGEIIVKTKPGAEVTVEQTRHEFLFGTCITDNLAEKAPNAMSEKDRRMFLKILKENFNYAVHENALKWYDCEIERGKVDYYLADRIWEMCNELGIPMRGHCIFWAKDKYIMPWLNELNTDELRKAVIERAKSVVAHFKGRITEYDLNNEMIHGDFFRRRLGYGIINEMAYAALSVDPDITLFVNDYGIIAEGGYNASTYIEQIKNLLNMGVPIGGIGVQAHVITSKPDNKMGIKYTTPELVQRNLDRLSQFNLPIKITECLFYGDTEEEKAEELKKFFPIFFAHPKVEAIIMWGFWEKGHWIPETAMWKKDWTPTPQAKAYRELVFKEWWTVERGKANKNGIFKVRGFYGNYKITSIGKTKEITLKKKDGKAIIEF